jgi:hypothetical protein
MSKRLFLGIVALSALSLLRTEANAASTCISWRNVGGTNCCTRWRTSSILVDVIFNQNCGPGGEGCDANISADTSNSIAFCENPSNPGTVIKTTCTEPVSFFAQANHSSYSCSLQTAQAAQTCAGPEELCPNGKGDCCGGLRCVDNSATDHTKVCRGRAATSGGGSGTSCASQTDITSLGNCQVACDAASPGSVVVDVVPIVMDTDVQLFVPTGGGGAPTPQAAQSSFECPAFSSFCEIQQHCTIAPKKIAYQAIQEYQCTVTSVSGGGGG